MSVVWHMRKEGWPGNEGGGWGEGHNSQNFISKVWTSNLLLSCGKVMFSQACVKNSVQGGSSVLACTTNHMTRGRVSVQGGLCQGVSVQGDLCLGGVSVRETPRTVTSGRYASYWNVFFFGIIFTEYCKEIKKIGLGVREGAPPPRSITANIIIATFLLLD